VLVKTAPPAPAPVIKAITPPPVPAPVPAPAPVPSEEITPGLRDLPEPIQRQIPPVALGGYMYSKDPADRLLLIDKVLRHEGEEVAPGLVLEKLQPKAAIFSFKGYRYRVPY
jgi:general secretion pathway protein B